MSEVIRISISLKVNTGDETYWSLIQPLQKNRQLSTFIVTCLKAYVEDSDIHDAIDMYNRKGSGVDRIREHIENLMKLQAKANRTAQDINNSLGGDSEEFEIENVLDNVDDDTTDDEVYSADVDEEFEQGDVQSVGSASYEKSVASEKKGQSGVKISKKAEAAGVKGALPASVEHSAINKIIKRLDSLEQTVGSLSSKVGANSAQLNKIGEQKPAKVADDSNDSKAEVNSNGKKSKQVVTNEGSKTVAGRAKAAEPVKEVRFENIGVEEAPKDTPADDKMDFSELLSGFMDSVQ